MCRFRSLCSLDLAGFSDRLLDIDIITKEGVKIATKMVRLRGDEHDKFSPGCQLTLMLAKEHKVKTHKRTVSKRKVTVKAHKRERV